jgi:hypothetical protein
MFVKKCNETKQFHFPCLITRCNRKHVALSFAGVSAIREKLASCISYGSLNDRTLLLRLHFRQKNKEEESPHSHLTHTLHIELRSRLPLTGHECNGRSTKRISPASTTKKLSATGISLASFTVRQNVVYTRIIQK